MHTRPVQSHNSFAKIPSFPRRREPRTRARPVSAIKEMPPGQPISGPNALPYQTNPNTYQLLTLPPLPPRITPIHHKNTGHTATGIGVFRPFVNAALVATHPDRDNRRGRPACLPWPKDNPLHPPVPAPAVKAKTRQNGTKWDTLKKSHLRAPSCPFVEEK